MNRDYDAIRNSFYKKYNQEFLIRQFEDFCSQTLETEFLNNKGKQINQLINFFFDDLIYKSKSSNGKYSPQEVLDNDELLTQAFLYIDSHPKFYKESDILNLKSYFRNSSKVGKVSNFNPVIARKIYEYYMPKENATILDYSCGFGTRLAGAASSPYNYNYIGIEPYTELYRRLLLFANWIGNARYEKGYIKIFHEQSENFIPELVDTIDLSFSSPPYFNYETYTSEKSQCYNQYQNYSDWLENYVLKTIQNIYSYTKESGLHLVNLQNVLKYNLIEDWLSIACTCGFSYVEKREILTTNRKSEKTKSLVLVLEKK